MRKKGYSLIEILITLSLIALITLVIVLNLSKTKQNQENKNLKEKINIVIGASQSYMENNNIKEELYYNTPQKYISIEKLKLEGLLEDDVYNLLMNNSAEYHTVKLFINNNNALEVEYPSVTSSYIIAQNKTVDVNEQINLIDPTEVSICGKDNVCFFDKNEKITIKMDEKILSHSYSFEKSGTYELHYYYQDNDELISKTRVIKVLEKFEEIIPANSSYLKLSYRKIYVGDSIDLVNPSEIKICVDNVCNNADENKITLVANKTTPLPTPLYSINKNAYTFTKSGTYKLDYAYNDNGKIVKNTRYISVYDKPIPVCKIDIIGTKGKNEWYVSNVELNINTTINDNKIDLNGNPITYQYGLGLAKSLNNITTVSLSDNMNQTTYYGHIKSSIGVASVCSVSIKIDKAKPILAVNMPTTFKIASTSIVLPTSKTFGISGGITNCNYYPISNANLKKEILNIKEIILSSTAKTEKFRIDCIATGNNGLWSIASINAVGTLCACSTSASKSNNLECPSASYCDGCLCKKITEPQPPQPPEPPQPDEPDPVPDPPKPGDGKEDCFEVCRENDINVATCNMECRT